MQKLFLNCLVLLLSVSTATAQQNDSSVISTLDTAAILKDLMGLIDADIHPTSYGLVEVGAGNRLFSIHNNRLNSRETSINTIVYTPVVGYFHKSGLSLSAGVYLLNQKNKGFGASQFTITPAYDLIGNDKIGFSISYTRSFVKDKFSPYASPIQHDFYSSVMYKKTWIQPALALGYSTGKYGDVFRKDTIFGNANLSIYDSTINHLKSFSIMVSAGHNFQWTSLLGSNDALLITPSVVLNMASSTIDITHHTNAPNLIDRLIKRGRLPLLVTNGFKAESAGFNFNCSYSAGDFTFSPQVYLDYYLPETDTNRFNQSYTFTIGYTF